MNSARNNRRLRTSRIQRTPTVPGDHLRHSEFQLPSFGAELLDEPLSKPSTEPLREALPVNALLFELAGETDRWVLDSSGVEGGK